MKPPAPKGQFDLFRTDCNLGNEKFYMGDEDDLLIIFVNSFRV
jgi:hypothetical protein